MPACNACKVLEARQAVLERKLNEVLERSGLSIEEIGDLEMDAVLDHSARTLDFSALKDLMRKRIERTGVHGRIDVDGGSGETA